MHRIWHESGGLTVGELVEIDGEEASHALRVKRLRPGEAVEILNGCGLIATGVVELAGSERGVSRAHSALRVRINGVRELPRGSPRVEVASATPKGDRLSWMIEQLCQIGVESWKPLGCARSVVEPRESKLTRLDRVVREACKQCGRAWTMDIADEIAPVSRALQGCEHALVLVADADGRSIDDVLPRPGASARGVRLLIGPEGGWTDEERSLWERAGATAVRLGPHTMRVETAAVVGAGVLLRAATTV